MKKFLLILALALAMLMVMPMAFAEEPAEEPAAEEEAITFDYANPIFVKNQDGQLLVKFKSEQQIGEDEDGNPVYKFEDWKVKTLSVTYATDVTVDDEEDLWTIDTPAECVTDAVIGLIPQDANGDPIFDELGDDLAHGKLLTNNPKDQTEGRQMTAKDKAVKDYSYYLYPSKLRLRTADQFLTIVHDTTENIKTLKQNIKALGHDFQGKVRVVKEATCEEGGEVIPFCERCKQEGTPIKTDPKGHVSFIAEDEDALDELITTGKYAYDNEEDGKRYTYKLVKKPTCSDKGSYTGYCIVCKKSGVSFQFDDVDPDEHNFGTWQVEKAATCEKEGLEYRLCKDCLDAKEQRVTDPLGHDIVADFAREATCTVKGLANSLSCTRCKLSVTMVLGEMKIKNATITEEELDELGYRKSELDNSKIEVDEDLDNHPAVYWELDEDESYAPTCLKAGKNIYVCSKCGNIANEVTLPATKHDVKVAYFYENEDGEWELIDAPTCMEDEEGNPYKQIMVTFCCNTLKDATGKFDVTDWTYDEITATEDDEDCTYAVKEETISAPEHVWGKWIKRNDPSDETPGLWERECTICHKYDAHIGYSAPKEAATEEVTEEKTAEATEEKTAEATEEKTAEATEEKTEEAKTEEKTEEAKTEEKTEEAKTEEKTEEAKTEEKTEEAKTEEKTAEATEEKTEEATEEKKDGIVKDADGKYRVYKDGEVDTTATGIVEYDGAKFFCTKGVLDTDYNGLALYDGTWYFLAAGKITAPTHPDGVVSYDGAYFKVKADGTVDTSATGVYDFDGGKFAFSDGQINTSVNGLYYDPISKEFVFCANGQVQTQFSGVAEYDGYFFVLKDGKLDDKDGTIVYGGEEFDVIKGQLFPKTAAAEETAA